MENVHMQVEPCEIPVNEAYIEARRSDLPD
jgi:hypothetical protein